MQSKGLLSAMFTPMPKIIGDQTIKVCVQLLEPYPKGIPDGIICKYIDCNIWDDIAATEEEIENAVKYYVREMTEFGILINKNLILPIHRVDYITIEDSDGEKDEQGRLDQISKEKPSKI